MALRYLQVFIPEDERADVDALLEDKELIGTWRDDVDDNRIVLHLILPAEETEAIMDSFGEEYAGSGGFRMVLLPVEAVLPRPEEQSADESSDDKEDEARKAGRVSREELYGDVSDSVVLNRAFIAMAALSAIVAAVGLVRDDVAIIIGAMVIAPLLGPNVGMSLAATLGDLDLLRRSLVANAVGLATVSVVSIAVGLIISFDPSVHAIVSRTNLSFGDLALGLAAGSAGTFAYTRGLSGAVIGVMVAVALVPPLVVSGMLLGAGYFSLALGAGSLVLANVVCINLAGVATFLAQGVRPRLWYEGERAKKATQIAVILWSIMLAILFFVAYLTDAVDPSTL